MLKKFVPVCIFLLFAGSSSCAVTNPSFEQGDGTPEGWSLSGYYGEWEDTGHTGEKCISLTGDGQHLNYWKCDDLSLEPRKVYRVTFWARLDGEVGGGCAISGPSVANRDYRPGADWKRYSYVLKMPEDTGDAYLRFGQWHVKGNIFFDDVAFNEVSPVHSKKGNIELGEGEDVRDGVYTASAQLDKEASNYSRFLFEHTAGFNSTRWVMGEDSYVIYRHNVAGIPQDKASVEIRIGYYVSGKCIVKVSTDGENYKQIGKLSRKGSRKFRVPRKLLPAKDIYVKLESSESRAGTAESRPGSFQIHGYEYRSVLKKQVPDLGGATDFVELIATHGDLKVDILSFGSVNKEGGNVTSISVFNASGRDKKLTVSVGIDNETFSKPVTAKSRNSVTVEIPYSPQLKQPGTSDINLIITESPPGRTLYHARSMMSVSSLHLRAYGYRLKDTPGALGLWWCEGTYKVSRWRPVPAETRRAIAISAAKNEYEPFQLVLRPLRDVKTVTVEASDLQNGKGARISKDNVTIDIAGYVNVRIPTDPWGITGSWPDPLPHYKGAFSLEADRNQPLWITVYVPPGTRAGDYTGTITLRADGKAARVPLELRVWNFSLPEETHVRSGFGFMPENIRRYHNIKNDGEWRKTLDLYYRNFSRHRMSPYRPMQNPVVSFKRDQAGNAVDVNIDFSRFDSDCRYFLDELGFNAFRMYVAGIGWGNTWQQRAGRFGGYDQGTPEYESLWGKYAVKLQKHLEEKGWLKKAYVYWFDEPNKKHYDFVIATMENLKQFAPKLTRMLTEQPEPSLHGHVDLWCPVIHHYNYEKARERQENGDEVWWYVCTVPKAPYPGLFIDHPAVDLRIWLWMTWQYKIDGVLIWQTNWWTSNKLASRVIQNPWTDPMSYRSGVQPGQPGYWGNGDGRFFYPPNRDVMNDKTKYLEGPVNSIRWELLREGIEDYEYLYLLKKVIEKLKASGVDRKVYREAEELLEIPKEIFSSPTTYTKDAQMLYEYRTKLALKLEELMSR